MSHCDDNAADRNLGAHWERVFCKMMAKRGKMFTPLQLGRSASAQAFYANGRTWHSLTLPDVTVWTAPGEHHEIKHKTPTRAGEFGLERYRIDALAAFAQETEQGVYYTIHDHRGDRASLVNRESDWITINVLSLAGIGVRRWGDSWVGGKKKRVPIMYWPRELWRPLFGRETNSPRAEAATGR